MKTLLRLSETNVNLKDGLKIELIQTTIAKNQGNSKGVFKHTLLMADLFDKSLTYFKSKECKDLLKANQVVMNVEEFLWDYFNRKKSFVYRCIKANRTTETEKKLYLDSDQDSYGIENFLKFLNNGEKDDKAKTEFKLKLTFGDAKLSIDDKDELKTDLTPEQINAVITILKRKLDGMA